MAKRLLAAEHRIGHHGQPIKGSELVTVASGLKIKDIERLDAAAKAASAAKCVVVTRAEMIRKAILDMLDKLDAIAASNGEQ